MKRDYKELFSVTVKHSYFHSGYCHNLEFIPTSETAILFNRYDMLMKTSQYGFTLCYNASLYSELQSILDHGDTQLDLCFSVYTCDYRYYYYTDPSTAPYFRNNGANPQLTPSYNLQNPPENTYDNRIFILFISLSSAMIGPQIPFRYYVPVSSNRTCWKYFIFCNSDTYQFDIIDSKKEHTFTLCDVISRHDTFLYTFISQTSIPLYEKPENRFKLVKKSMNHSQKTAVYWLPCADSNNLYTENHDSNNRYSYIYVNI